MPFHQVNGLLYFFGRGKPAQAKPYGAVEVCLVGGALYLDVMQHFVELFQEDGFVTGSAAVTEICAPIGIMRQQMTAWLNRSAEGGNR